jgi:hypothetical protein
LHIIDRKGAKNPIAHNLSRLENVLDDPLPIDDSFPDEQLAVINASRTAPWYVLPLEHRVGFPLKRKG